MTDKEQPSRRNPCWITAFESYARTAATPKEFLRWAGLATVSGALERRVWLRTSAGKLYPNLFILLVAAPGVGKDMAIIPARDLMAKAGRFSLAPPSMTHKGLVDQLADRDSSRSMITPDGSWFHYHTMQLIVPEFGVIMPSNDLGLLSTVNDLYNCPNLYSERIRMKGEEMRIENPHISILAGTQPMYLAELFPEAAYGMGFMSRIIMIYGANAPKQSLFATKGFSEAEAIALSEDLKQLADLYGEFTLTPPAIEAIEQWHLSTSATDGPSHTKLMHYNSRRTIHVLKLSMAVSASRRSTLQITEEDFTTALSWLLAAESVMPQIFREMTSGGQSDVMEEALNFIILSGKGKPVSEARLIQFLTQRLPASQIDYIINAMVKSEIIREDGPTAGLNIPGRPRLFKAVGYAVE